MKPVNNVDEYITQAPREVQEKLQGLRAVIMTTAPGAEERISYGMPYYDYKGRLVYFQLWKKHIGLYIPTPVVEEHKSELKGYETTKAMVRFPLDEKLPLVLIEKLVKARVVKNDEAEKKKSFFKKILLYRVYQIHTSLKGVPSHETVFYSL